MRDEETLPRAKPHTIESFDPQQRCRVTAWMAGSTASIVSTEKKRATRLGRRAVRVVVTLGCQFDVARKHQRGVGVATAALLEAGLLVVSQRDLRTVACLRARLDPSFVVDPTLRDRHQHPWVLEHLPGPHART